MITMGGALDDFFEVQITSTLENLMSEENIDEEGQAFISKLKEGLDIIRKLQEGKVPEEEKGLLVLQLESIQLSMLDYSLQDRRKRISLEKLPDRLEAIGLLDAYKKWNEELINDGFIMNDVIDEDLMEFKTLSYSYTGHFAVEGDHADDVFGLSARITENGLDIGYWSSKLSLVYLGYWDEVEPLRNPEGIEKIKSFLEKHREFICDYSERIEVCNDGYFQMHFDNDTHASLTYYARGTFIKLAVLLDKELRKRYPFENIKGYELFSRVKLAQTIEDFEVFEPSKWMAYRQIRNHECLHHRDLLDIIIMSSYQITQKEALEKFNELSSALMKLRKKQREYDDQCGREKDLRPYAVSEDGKEYSEEEYVASLVEEIREMSAEEFEIYKDQLFDL